MTKLDCAGLLGAGSQILRLLLRIPPQWQTITAFPIGLTEETLISEPIFKALYDVTSLKPLDKVSTALSMHGGSPVVTHQVQVASYHACPVLLCSFVAVQLHMQIIAGEMTLAKAGFALSLSSIRPACDV